MISIPGYEGHGRRMMVEFMCWRCKQRVVRPLVDCLPKDGPVRDMSDLKPPAGWQNGGFYYPTFCPDCAKKYDEFMKGDENNNETQETV